MSVKEVRQALGNWSVALRPDTPRELTEKIEANKFGHIAIIPGRINPKLYRDGMLESARYIGVYRAIFKQSDDVIEIKGAGMAFWLGDEDDKGDVFETAVELEGDTFADSVRALLPPNGAVTEGIIHSIPGAGTYTNSHQWETPRKALTYLTETFSSEDNIVEWRVNGDGTLDAGPISELYNVSVPRAILVKRDTGRDMRLLGLQARMSLDYDVEDLTTRIVLLAQGEGETISTGTADADPLPYRDLHGNEIVQTRLVSESETSAENADIRAELQLRRWSLPRQAIQISTDDFDIKGDFVVGDYIYVYDPEGGFYDLDNEVFWKGQPINPIALRIVEMDWKIRPGWTVAFRCNDGEWLDLSEYYKSEGGGSTLAVGDYRRTLAGNNYEPLGFRPNLPSPGADSTVPRAPVFTGFSVGSYQSETFSGIVKAAILAQWAEPLNTDGSTVTDGGHYEIRYRVSQIIGYQVSWDTLSGYVASIVDTFSARSITNGWDDPETGTDWTVIDGTASNFSVADGVGRISLSAANDPHIIASTTEDDSRGEYRVTIPFEPSGAGAFFGVALRCADADNHIQAGFAIGTDNSITLKVFERVEGSATELGTGVDTGYTHVEDTEYIFAYNCFGDSVSVKVYPALTADPGFGKTVETSILTGTTVGVYAKLDPDNDNALPQIITYENINILGRDTDNAYSWDDLGTWDGLVSEAIQTDRQWHSVFVGWDSTSHTIMELTPAITYELQIRAVDAASPPNRSAWSGSSFVTTTGDIFPPSTPAAPTVAASLIAIQVTHFLGKSSGGTFNLEPDLDHFEVHVGGSDSFFADASTKVGELIATGGMVTSQIPAVGTFQIPNVDEVHVKVVAVDRSGNKSPASEAATATAELIDDAHISNLSVSKLTAGTISAQMVLASELEIASGGNIKVTDGALRVYEGQTGLEKVKAGYDSDSDTYDLFAVNPDLDQLVSLSTLAFGIKSDTASGFVTRSSNSYATLSDGPILENVRIGSSQKAIVFLGTSIGWDDGGPSGSFSDSRTGLMSFRIIDESDDTEIFSGADNFALIAHIAPSSVAGGNLFTQYKFRGFYVPPSVITAAGSYTFEAVYKSQTGGGVIFQGRSIFILPY